ncbi:MAG: hypothetical protein AAF682_20805 [Planctomycetota bacterium]
MVCLLVLGLAGCPLALTPSSAPQEPVPLAPAEIEHELARLAALDVSVDYRIDFSNATLDLVKLAEAGVDVESVRALRDKPEPTEADLFAAADEARRALAAVLEGSAPRGGALDHWRGAYDNTSTPAYSVERGANLSLLDWRDGGLAYRASTGQLSLETAHQLPAVRDVAYLMRPFPTRRDIQDSLRVYLWSAQPAPDGAASTWSAITVREPEHQRKMSTLGLRAEDGLPSWGAYFDVNGVVHDAAVFDVEPSDDGVAYLREALRITFEVDDRYAMVLRYVLTDHVLHTELREPVLTVPTGTFLYDLTSGAANARWYGVDTASWPEQVSSHVAFDASAPPREAGAPPPASRLARLTPLAGIGVLLLGVVLFVLSRRVSHASA